MTSSDTPSKNDAPPQDEANKAKKEMEAAKKRIQTLEEQIKENETKAKILNGKLANRTLISLDEIKKDIFNLNTTLSDLQKKMSDLIIQQLQPKNEATTQLEYKKLRQAIETYCKSKNIELKFPKDI